METMLRGHISRFTEYRVNSLPFFSNRTGLALYHTCSVLESWTSSVSCKLLVFQDTKP